eukprot:gene13677-18353_t
MFLIIGVWGSRERSVRAGITGTLNLEIITFYLFSEKEQIFLWMSFFLSFASKIPMYPLHIWLPEAHVEAPTVGSVLLAVYFSPLIYLLGTLGIIYASMTAIRQTDLKRILAYSSIAHMNLVALGIFSFNILGFEGAVLQSLSHGFVSGGLFFLVGVVYERYHSRSLFYYTGLAHTMPVYVLILFIFTLANIALPGTSSFVDFMLLTKKKPTSSGIRHTIQINKCLLTKKNGFVKTGLKFHKRALGRSSSTGHITSWHRGGGCKKVFSTINFSNRPYSALLICVMYDSFRNSFVNLNFDLKKKSFFKTLAAENLFPGSLIESSPSFLDYRLGFRTQINKIPAGTLIYNLSLNSHRLGSYIRAAGTYGQIVQRDLVSSKIKMPSGKFLMVPSTSYATVGINSNLLHKYSVLGKAGKNRLRSRRPIVRGIAMNPVDHPHGGRTNGGRTSVTPWGLPTKCGFYLKKKKRYDKVWTRRSVIPSSLVGKSVSVHYGNGFKKITITREKVGFKFGSFSYTRRS